MTVPKEDSSICIFCKILKGEAPVSMIFEDDKIAVFPTIEPVNPGHLLIIPILHAPYLSDLEEETAAYIMITAKKMAQAIRRTDLRCEGINIFVADGEAAGQDVFHFHLHVYPRYKDDGFGFKYDKSRHFIRTSRAELDRVAQDVRAHIEPKIDFEDWSI